MIKGSLLMKIESVRYAENQVHVLARQKMLSFKTPFRLPLE